MKANNILELIGKTPVVKLNHLFGNQVNVWLKLERQNPGGSIKDRIALAMIEDAEKTGLLKPGGLIVEPTSGNTGIGLAMVAAVKGYSMIVVMPESMSEERRKVLRAYGAEIVLTPKEGWMKASIEKAKEIAQLQNGWMPMQFENTANPEIHSRTTAIEILQDFGTELDVLITGVGTGGHISGISKVLKKEIPHFKTIAVEPEGSAVIGGGLPGPHKIQGIGAGFIPGNLDVNLIDEIVNVSDEEAYDFARRAALEEGIFVGISTGASLAAISKILPQLEGKTILTMQYDGGDKYLSVHGLW